MGDHVSKVLVIAGSDSSGGAGLEADQRVLTAHGVYACTATTALTAQNTLGVQDIHVTPPAFLAKQIDAVVEDIRPQVVKIGMLASASTVDTVVDRLIHWNLKRVVLDPVMVSTSGSQLLPGDAVATLIKRMTRDLPVELVTPNVPEAILMIRELEGKEDDFTNDQPNGKKTGFRTPQSLEELIDLAKFLQTKLQCRGVLLKGGHVPFQRNGEDRYVRAEDPRQKEYIVDVLYDGKDVTTIVSQYVESKNTHGTGCSLASAIAAGLAKELDVKTAVRQACRYVAQGIRTSKSIGRGSGPIDHFHSLQIMPFTSGNFIEYLLNRADVQPVWHEYTHHRFANAMGHGTLPLPLFRNYMIQDYLYLTHFARTTALSAYKSTDMDAISAAAEIVLHIEQEMRLHLEYCNEFGLSKDEIIRHKESLACVAYSRYVLDIGHSQDWLALQMALAPCLIGYNVVAKRLMADPQTKRIDNKYFKWIENYVADDYQQAVKKGSVLLESHVYRQSPARVEELVNIFIRATEMEVQFWEYGAHGTTST